jgi:hypothetical protein
MQACYGMQAVMVPEDKHLKPDQCKASKCAIFMSKEFINPDAKQKAINAEKHALILI